MISSPSSGHPRLACVVRPKQQPSCRVVRIGVDDTRPGARPGSSRAQGRPPRTCPWPARSGGGRRIRWAAARVGRVAGQAGRCEARERGRRHAGKRRPGRRRTGGADGRRPGPRALPRRLCPAYITITRSQVVPSTDRSWLISIRPRPSSLTRSLSRLSTCACTITSSAVVGSSAMISCGWQASASAIMIRCFWPPESWCGYAVARLAGRPTCSSSSPTRAAAWLLADGRVVQQDRLGDLVADLLHRVERVQGALEDDRRLGPAQCAQVSPRASCCVSCPLTQHLARRPWRSSAAGAARSTPASTCRSRTRRRRRRSRRPRPTARPRARPAGRRRPSRR